MRNIILILILGLVAVIRAQPAPPAAFPPPPPAETPPSGPTTPQQIKALIAKLNSSAQPTEQTFALNRLIAIGTEALPYLHEELLQGRYTYSRIQITRILAKIGDASSLPVLEQVTSTPYPNLNRAAVLAITAIAGTNAQPILLRIRSSTADTNLITTIREEEAKIRNRSSQPVPQTPSTTPEKSERSRQRQKR